MQDVGGWKIGDESIYTKATFTHVWEEEECLLNLASFPGHGGAWK